MNPVVQAETSLNRDHYAVDLTREDRRAFSLDREEVYVRAGRIAQNFCLILFDRYCDDYFAIPIEVVAKTIIGGFPAADLRSEGRKG